MKRKSLLLIILSVCLALSASFTSLAGWKKVDGFWKYQNEDGSYAVNAWKQNKSGNWYYIGSNGRIVRDSIIDGEYYVNSEGIMMTNWLYKKNLDEGYDCYYFDENGEMIKNGWHLATDDKWRYAEEDGKLLLDLITPDGYYVNFQGEWIKGITAEQVAVVKYLREHPMSDESCVSLLYFI